MSSAKFRQHLRGLIKIYHTNPTRLAEAAGLSPSAIHDILKRDRKPRHDSLEKIAQALGMSVADLLRDQSQDVVFYPTLLSATITEVMKQLSLPGYADPEALANQIVALYESLASRQSKGEAPTPIDIASAAKIITVGTRNKNSDGKV